MSIELPSVVLKLAHPINGFGGKGAIDVDAENIQVSQSLALSLSHVIPAARSVGGAPHFRARHPNTEAPQNVIFLLPS